MTEVYFGVSNGWCNVECKGHATGSNEVCAAVSCLCYTLLSCLQNSGVEYGHNIADGYFFAEFEDRGLAKDAYKVVGLGFRQLAANYPKYIRCKM